MFSMKTVLSTILRNFKINTDLKMSDLKVEFEIALKLANKHMVRIERRKWWLFNQYRKPYGSKHQQMIFVLNNFFFVLFVLLIARTFKNCQIKLLKIVLKNRKMWLKMDYSDHC